MCSENHGYAEHEVDLPSPASGSVHASGRFPSAVFKRDVERCGDPAPSRFLDNGLEANRMQTRTLSSDRRDPKREAVDAQDLVLTRQMWSQHGMAQKRSCATVTTMQFMSLAASGGWLDVVGRGMR